MPERLRYSDYTRTITRESVYVHGKMVEDTASERFVCPRCKAVHLPIEHGKRLKCTCGLTMERWGNALDIIDS